MSNTNSDVLPPDAPGFDQEAGGEASTSPLWMLTKEPILHDFISYLVQFRTVLEREPAKKHHLCFSGRQLREVRGAFGLMIRRGEERLHRLSELLCDSFLGSYLIESVVFGEVESTQERFTLMQHISADDLHSTTDIDLGNRQLQKLRIHDGKGWSGASLVANVVEYQPTEPNRYAIQKIISRIKAEEEIWNKVVDEIFNLDSLVRRDKKLWALSRYVKDVFGLKIVAGTPADVRKLQVALQALAWDSGALERFHVSDVAAARSLEFVEVKDYLGQTERKNSGWEAIKSVVRWWDKMFEIQIQPLRAYFREREYLTKESHVGFKRRREDVRDQIAKEVPLFGFYRDLLHWLFSDTSKPAPVFDGVEIVLAE